MAIDTKPNLDFKKFEQFTGDTLNLSGTTVIYGNIVYGGSAPNSPTSQTLADRDYVDSKVATGVTVNVGNGLSKNGSTIVFGGTLTGDTILSTTGGSLTISTFLNNVFLHKKYFSSTHGDNTGSNYYNNGGYDVIEDTEDNIWVSDINANGLWRYNKITKSSDKYSTSIAGQGSGPNLPNNTVYSLDVTTNGLFLAATYGGGLWVYNVTGDSSNIYNTSGGGNSGLNLPDNNTYAVVSDATYIYVGTESGGIWRLNRNTLVGDIFNNAGGANSGSNLPSDDVYTLTINNGSLYAGTSSGIWRLNLGTLVGSVYNTSGGANIGADLPENFVYPLRSIGDYIIAGTSSSGVWVYNTVTNASQIFSTLIGAQTGLNLIDDTVANISVDPISNNFYVEGGNFISNDGAYWRYNFDSNTSDLFKPRTDIYGLSGLTVTSQSKIYFDADSNVWLTFGDVFLNLLYSGLTRNIEYGISGITYTDNTLSDYLGLNSFVTLGDSKTKTFKFLNGLTKTTPSLTEFNEADTVKLGGIIGETTTVSVTGGTFNIRNLNTINYNALTVNTGSTEVGYGQIFPANNRARMLFTSSGINFLLGANTTFFVVNDNRPTKKGIEYNNIDPINYTAFTINTLAPVGYVTGYTSTAFSAGSGLTLTSGVFDVDLDPAGGLEFNAGQIKAAVGNGLTLYASGNSIHLGGSLTEAATTISGGGNSLSFQNTLFSVDGTQLTMNSTVQTNIQSTARVFAGLTSNGGSLDFTTGGTIFLDNSNVVSDRNGIQYAADYSANYTNRSLVDKGYVTGYVTGLTTTSGVQTANNGLTKSGTNVRLGGSLTGNTEIAGGGFYLNLGSTASKLNVLSATTTANQFFKSDLVTVDEKLSPFTFIANTDVNAGRNVVTFNKRSSSGTPNVNNAGLARFVLPTSTLVEKSAIDMLWRFPTTTNGSETSSLEFRGYYTGSSASNLLRVHPGYTHIGHGSGGVGGFDLALGQEARAFNGGQIAIGYRAAKTSGAATGRLYPISIGFNTNQGTSPIGDYSIAIGNLAKSFSADTISIGRQAGNTTGVVQTGYISIGVLSNQGSSNIGLDAIAIGNTSKSVGNSSIAIGSSSLVNGVQGIGIGLSSNAGGQGTIAIGSSAKAQSFLSLSIGNDAGNTSGTDNTEAISIGASANQGTTNIGQRSIAIGSGTKTKSSYSISVGYQAGNTTGTDGGNVISIGQNTNQGTGNIGANSITIGLNGNQGTLDVGQDSITIGSNSKSRSQNSISIGASAGLAAGTIGTDAISIGTFSNNSDGTNIGTRSIGLGYNVKATQINAIAIGTTAFATGTTAVIAIGSNSKSHGISIGEFSGNNSAGTNGTNAISIGYYSNQGTGNAIGSNSIAIGTNTKSITNNSIAIGNGSLASGDTSNIAIGVSTIARNQWDIAIGNNTNVNGGGGGSAAGIGIGGWTISTGTSATAIGYFAHAGGIWSHAIGRSARTKAFDQISFGTGAGNTTGTGGNESISIGRDANQGSSNIGFASIAMSTGSESIGDYSLSIGNGTKASGNANISIGYQSSATGSTNQIAVGNTARVWSSNGHGIAIGTSAYVTNQDGIAIGRNAESNTGQAIGNDSNANGGGVAVGSSANASISGTIAIGSSSNGGSTGGIAIGQSTVAANSTVAIGYVANQGGSPGNEGVHIGAAVNQSVNAGDSSIAIGSSARSTGIRSIAIGKNARATNTNSYIIGAMSAATTNNVENSLQISWGVPNQDIVFVKGTLTTTGVTTGTLVSFTLSDTSVYSIKTTIKGRHASGTDRALYVKQGLFYREGGGATQQGSTVDVITPIESNASWDAALDVSGNDVRVRVTGVAATNINWHVILEAQRV